MLKSYPIILLLPFLILPTAKKHNKIIEIEFYVKDSGIGIKPELQEKIFEQFSHADVNIQYTYGCTGLGLSISKGFIELPGGKIWVNSAVGKGSTFYFTIPYKPVNKTDAITPVKLIDKKNNRPTILIAEDEEFNFLYIEKYSDIFDDYLAKPIQEDVLVEKVNKYLAVK